MNAHKRDDWDTFNSDVQFKTDALTSLLIKYQQPDEADKINKIQKELGLNIYKYIYIYIIHVNIVICILIDMYDRGSERCDASEHRSNIESWRALGQFNRKVEVCSSGDLLLTHNNVLFLWGLANNKIFQHITKICRFECIFKNVLVPGSKAEQVLLLLSIKLGSAQQFVVGRKRVGAGGICIPGTDVNN